MHCKLYSIYVCEFAYMISGIWAGFGFGFLFMLMLHFTIFSGFDYYCPVYWVSETRK